MDALRPQLQGLKITSRQFPLLFKRLSIQAIALGMGYGSKRGMPNRRMSAYESGRRSFCWRVIVLRLLLIVGESYLLLRWVTHQSERRATGRLYIAPGGFGKTRLGMELLIQLKSLGW